jgi:hypothetical protein
MAAAKRNIIHEETNTILFGQMAKFNIWISLSLEPTISDDK